MWFGSNLLQLEADHSFGGNVAALSCLQIDPNSIAAKDGRIREGDKIIQVSWFSARLFSEHKGGSLDEIKPFVLKDQRC